MQKIDADKITSIIALILLGVLALLIGSSVIGTSSKDEVRFLVNEMVTTPDRQQNALDKLAQYDDDILMCLFDYFDDARPIASQEVKFLNTSPMVGEKYFHTGGERVNQVLIQYFCWRTERCVVTSETDVEKIKHQLEAEYKVQKGANGLNNALCKNGLTKRVGGK